MSIGKLNFDEISEADLRALVDVGVAEGVLIEYKRETYGNNDDSKKEFLKDISSFANTQGGHLVIGVEESGGVPIALPGVPVPDSDKELLRLESVVQSGIEPRIPGVRMRVISLASGTCVIVIRVPRSWNPPHRVSAKGHNKFYVRNSAGVHEASVEELRALFSMAATAHDRIRAFRMERLALLRANEGPVRLASTQLIVLHMLPLSAFSSFSELDLELVHSQSRLLRPIGAETGMTPSFNFDGFINIRGGRQCNGYTQVFRNGVIEATKSDYIYEHEGRRIIHAEENGAKLIEAIPPYLAALKELEVPPPIAIGITLLEAAGAYVGIGEKLGSRPQAIDRVDLLLPEVVVQSYGEEGDYHRAVRPAFDALWNAAGFSKSTYFNEQGIWVGNQRARR